MSTGILDDTTGTLFAVDSFGAILPAAAQQVSAFDEADLTAGMLSWATFDSPWVHLVDRQLFGETLEAVRRLAPSTILSSHLPAAGGTSLEAFLGVLERVPDAESFVPPDQQGFEAMLAAMQAEADGGQLA
jgi:hypothetical protein